MAGDAPEGVRHERKRQEGNEGQPPVDAEEHHRQHHHQRERAVEGREHRFAGRHLDGIHVVGGERHQVAGALALVKIRSLPGKPAIQPRAQLDAELVGSGEQLQTPADAHEINGQTHRRQPGELHQQFAPAEPVRYQRIDHRANLARNRYREHGDDDEHETGRGVGKPVLAHEGADELGQGHEVSCAGRACRSSPPGKRPALLSCYGLLISGTQGAQGVRTVRKKILPESWFAGREVPANRDSENNRGRAWRPRSLVSDQADQMQFTWTLVTSAEPIVAVPLVTVQVWPAGWTRTATP